MNSGIARSVPGCSAPALLLIISGARLQITGNKDGRDSSVLFAKDRWGKEPRYGENKNV